MSHHSERVCSIFYYGLSGYVQVRALRTTAALCTMLLSQWSSLPQEDQQTLSLGLDSAGQPLSNDMKLATQFRLQKKRLLLQAVNEISKQIQVRTQLMCQLGVGTGSMHKTGSSCPQQCVSVFPLFTCYATKLSLKLSSLCGFSKERAKPFDDVLKYVGRFAGSARAQDHLSFKFAHQEIACFSKPSLLACKPYGPPI